MSSRAVPARPAAGPPPERSDRTFVVVAVILALACLAGFVLLPRLSAAQRDTAEPKAAPGFNLPVIHNGEPGSRLDLADLQGGPVLLDFWATWCPPCDMMTPILDRLARRYEGRGLRVIGVNVNDDDPVSARAYAKRRNLSYPIVLDETGAAQRAYGANKLPTMILIDKNGQVVHVASGVVDEASLDKMLRDVL
jgi:thiol-disulfide isomerase/thioredoxin